MPELDDIELLAQYARDHSEAAFAMLVTRHVNLVYSTALRSAGNPHAAEEIAQAVFVILARKARSLSPRTVISGWLYQTARLTAANFLRAEIRRQHREQEAYMQSLLNEPEPNVWPQIAPLLDAAMAGLGEKDRNAVVLRFFENKSLGEVGRALGASEDAAKMRVNRALEKLRKFFSKRGVVLPAALIAGAVSANSVHAAPVGLAATISSSTLAGTAVSTSTIIAATKIIAMTTLQKTVITATLAVVAGAGVYEARQASQLREQNQVLQQQQAPLADQLRQLQRERDDATNRLAALVDELADAKKNPAEVLKLRGEVGALRQEKAIAGSQNALNKLTANPETRKTLRDQQKTGMSTLYSDLVKRLNLTPEQAGQLNDLLADHVMDSIDLITQALHDNKTRGEIDQLFSAQNSALQDQLLALIGPDGMAQYQDYTKNLLSTLTAAQFAGSLTGDPTTVADKKSQFLQAMQAATQSALAAAGLPADYQTVPMLNFANIASAEEGAQSLQLLDSIYVQVAASASAFLSADELNKFQEYRTNAIQRSQTMLLMNRKMMAPISQ